MSAALLVLAAAARAGDLDAAEKRWARTCVENLSAKSERLRTGAEAGLSALGTDAIPVVLGALDKLKADADWQALARAIAGMDGADALEALERKWPKGSQTRLGEVVKLSRALAKPAKEPAAEAEGVAPTSTSEVTEKVRKLLDKYRTVHFMSSEDPEMRQLIALGHAAFGALLQELCTSNKGPGMGMAKRAISSVIEQIAREGDEPAVAALLREGCLEAAIALKKIRTPAALEALVDCVNRGFVSHTVIEALEPWRREPRVSNALLEWMRAHGRSGRFETGTVAEFLGESGVADAVPMLVPLLGSTAGTLHMRIAEALTRLGEKTGIPALIDVFAGEGPRDFTSSDWDRHVAGEALNRLARRALYSGSFLPGKGATGNFAEATKAFRDWWNKVKDTIRWDPARRAWIH